MHLCKKQNESKLQMVARPAHSKGTCPLPLVGSLHSWQLGGGTAHRPGNFRVKTSCPPSPWGAHCPLKQRDLAENSPPLSTFKK